MTMRHFGWSLIVLVFLTVASVLYLLCLLFLPVKTITIENFSYQKPIHIETPVVHPGDVIRYELEYCKFTDIVPTAKSQLIDGQIIPLTPSDSTGSGLPKGCHKTVREVIIPKTINPGRYYFNRQLDYRINAVRTERVYYYTEYFQVVEEYIPSTSAPPIGGVTAALPPIPGDINQMPQ